ncbi:MAG: hypothetical protein ACE5HJ_07120 [Thermoplasmata archaeon]
MISRLSPGISLREWIGNLVYMVVALVAPMAIILANAFWNFGGILLTIALIVWMGFSLVILSPLIE